jgi:hypothetical protein
MDSADSRNSAPRPLFSQLGHMSDDRSQLGRVQALDVAQVVSKAVGYEPITGWFEVFRRLSLNL